MLFLGAPGTGKTMLSKAIATSFNCPFVTIPGSGFAQTFIGMDAVIVRFLARKAKKLAAQVGRPVHRLHRRDRRRRACAARRSGAGIGRRRGRRPRARSTTTASTGPSGALTPDGDLMLETRAWRERLFAARAEPPRSPLSAGGPADRARRSSSFMIPAAWAAWAAAWR